MINARLILYLSFESVSPIFLDTDLIARLLSNVFIYSHPFLFLFLAKRIGREQSAYMSRHPSVSIVLH